MRKLIWRQQTFGWRVTLHQNRKKWNQSDNRHRERLSAFAQRTRLGINFSQLVLSGGHASSSGKSCPSSSSRNFSRSFTNCRTICKDAVSSWSPRVRRRYFKGHDRNSRGAQWENRRLSIALKSFRVSCEGHGCEMCQTFHNVVDNTRILPDQRSQAIPLTVVGAWLVPCFLFPAVTSRLIVHLPENP
jgi:hypothetical protein